MRTIAIPTPVQAKLTDRPVEPSLRELDYRTGDGIGVWLLWNPETNRVSIAIEDARRGESLTFDVDPGEALRAFHHPYMYASGVPAADWQMCFTEEIS